jgi:hypothetical protein
LLANGVEFLRRTPKTEVFASGESSFSEALP